MRRSWIRIVALSTIVCVAVLHQSASWPTTTWANGTWADEADTASTNATGVIEAMVRHQFEQQTKRHAERIAKAEANLEQIRLRFQQRQQNAETIMAEQVAAIQKRAGTAPAAPAAPDDAPASVLSTEGWQAWQKRDYRKSLGLFEQAIAKEPKNAAALNGLGWTLLHLGEHERSIEILQRVLKIEPQHLGALNGIGQNFAAMGKPDEAVTQLTKATLAVIDEFGEATAVKNQMTASWHGLVRLLVQQKKYDEALDWAERYLRHAPGDDFMTQMRDQAQAAASEPAEAIEPE